MLVRRLRPSDKQGPPRSQEFAKIGRKEKVRRPIHGNMSTGMELAGVMLCEPTNPQSMGFGAVIDCKRRK